MGRTRAIVDGAHNPAAVQTLAETWRENFGDQRATLILAVLSDKDLRAICEALAPISEFVLLPKIRSERAAAPEELARVLTGITPSLPCSITPSIGDALSSCTRKTESYFDYRIAPFRRRSACSSARRTGSI